MTKIYTNRQLNSKKEDVRVTRTKRDLADALESLLETMSYDSISVIEICTTALVSKLTFYNNFLNKNELMLYVFRRASERTIKAFQTLYFKEDDEDKIYRGILKAMIHLFYLDESSFRKLLKKDTNKSLYTVLYTFVKEELPKFIRYENPSSQIKVPAEIVYSYYAGAITGLLYNMASEDFGCNSEEMSDYIYAITNSTLFSYQSIAFDVKEDSSSIIDSKRNIKN